MVWTLKRKVAIWATIILILGVFPNQAFSAPELIQARMKDGVVLRVHLPIGSGKGEHTYARQILKAACYAYEEIVCRQGFDRSGYTFAHSSRIFAYDRDQIIDIYMADIESPFALTQTEGGLEYRAEIFVPENYREYRNRYQIEQEQLELKASLTHELLHIITYSYNRNMQTNAPGKAKFSCDPWDWYTEGLARYFEALVGYRQEFLSCGFRKDRGDKIMVYKGGVNYFLKYPDRPLNERKYDFALFWQYLHQTYGMEKIEDISVKFRQLDPQFCSNKQAMQIIAETLGIQLEDLWRNFSLYVYKKSSLPDEKEAGLNPVSMVNLTSLPRFTHSICSFGLNFYEIDLKKDSRFIELRALNSQGNLNCLVGIHSSANFSSKPIKSNSSGKIKIDTSGFKQNSKIIIMLSNPNNQSLSYHILIN